MEQINPDIVRILKEIGRREPLQNHLADVLENLSPFVSNGYDIDVFNIPAEGITLTVFVATKKGETPYAVVTKVLRRLTTTVTGTRMRVLIINAAKDIMERRLRQKILGQWVLGGAIMVLLLAMAFPFLHYPSPYDNNYMLITSVVGIAATLGGCGVIPWLASRMFLERAWRRDPVALIIGHQLQTLSTD